MLEWTLQAPFGAFPPPTYDFSAVGIGHKVYVFGGNRNPEGSVPRLSHDLHVLDLDTGFWEQQKTSPLQPCARAGHNMVVAGSSIYVLCGWAWHNDDTLYLGDTFVYSTNDDMWTPIHATGTPPIGRAHASASYFREHLFLFGGCNGTIAANFRRDMMVLNLRTLNWTEMQSTTPAPSGRSHMAMCPYNGQLYVFGGHNLQGGKKRALGDLQVFDIKERTWTLLSDSDFGQGPSARAWHSMVTCQHGIFLFGGAGDATSAAPFYDALWVFNPVSKGWHNLSRRSAREDHDPSLLPKRPNARAAMAMANASDSVLYVLGGISSRPKSSTSSAMRPQSRNVGDITIMGDVFKVNLQRWHADLPADELEAEFNQADFTGRALATMPRHAGTGAAGALSARGGGVELAHSPGRYRSMSSVSSSTSASGSTTARSILSEDLKARKQGGAGHGRVSVAESSTMVWELHAPKGDGAEGEAPSPRSGHAAVTIGRRMYVCGGLAEDAGVREYLMDMFRLDLDRMLWSRVEVPDRADGEEGYMPEGRAGHSMVAVETGRSEIWLLCGWFVHDNKSFFLNNVHTFDTLARTWRKVDTVGEAPAPRAYASVAVYKTKIIMFGGCNGTLATHFRNDLWALDVQHNTWSRIDVPVDQVQPVGRAQHTMVHYGGVLYVFGGNNKRAGKRHLLSDLYSFDLTKNKWVLLNDGHGHGEAAGNGEAPSKRSGHAMVLQNGGLFVFGGGGLEQGADGFYDSLWVFDTAAQRWSLLTQEDEEGLVGSKRPCARAGHSMVAVGNQVYVFGGLCPSGGGQGAGVRPLGDLASFHSTGWRHAMPKFVSDRKREAATRLLAKLQGLDDHAASRLLDTVHAFRGAAREAYNKALDNPFGTDEDEVEVVDPNVIPLSHNISAQLSVLNQRIDSMVGRIAPERRNLLQMQRHVQLAPIMAKGGLLDVTVHSGRDLPKMDRFGKSDPYCIIEADGQKQKTKILKKTLNPVWKEKFSFKVTDTGSKVVVTCFDWDFADDHDYMGEVVVKLDDLLDGPLDRFFTLRDHDGNTMQGSLRLQLAYRPADTGVNDTKSAIASALQTLLPEEQEEILGVGWDGGDSAPRPRQGAKKPTIAAMDLFDDPEEAAKAMPPVHKLALQEDANQKNLRQAAAVERHRQDNLAEIERLRRQQLRDEELERRIRQLSKLEKLEEEQVALRRVEREEAEVEAALKSKLINIATVAQVGPVDPAIKWDENPAQQLHESLEAEYQAMHEASSPPRRDPPPPQPLKPRPPEVVKRGEGGAGGGRPRPPSSKGAAEAGGGEGAEGGSGQGQGHVRKSVLTTMFGKGVSVEAKRRMLEELKAKKKGEADEDVSFQQDVRAMQEKMRLEEEKIELEKQRQAKLDAHEAQRRKVALQLQQEERAKAQAAEKRSRVIAELEEAEAMEKERTRMLHAELEVKRKQKLAAEEERRRNDPELVARAKRLNQYVATSTMRNLSSIKKSQLAPALAEPQMTQAEAAKAATEEERRREDVAHKTRQETSSARMQFGDEIANVLENTSSRHA